MGYTLFRKAADGDRGSLDAALRGCRSTVDWPGTFFWRELVEQYPDARVVLEFEVGRGWDPLCAFLRRPVPETPFPRLNDAASFAANLGRGFAAGGRSAHR